MELFETNILGITGAQTEQACGFGNKTTTLSLVNDSVVRNKKGFVSVMSGLKKNP